MDRVGEATFHLGKSAAAAETLTAPAGNGNRKMEAKRRSVNGVRVVRAGGGKDRHSKVSTARGTRDRRVRLSPKTAILFYDVQERLGCDRPSKALDWLMNEAKPAIDALDHRPPAAAHHSTATIEEPPPPLPPSDDCEGKFMADVELCDANSEIVKWQRFSDCISSAPLHYPAPANYDSFGEREPLQSSYSRFNYGNSSQFQGYEFVDEDPELAFEQISFLHTL